MFKWLKKSTAVIGAEITRIRHNEVATNTMHSEPFIRVLALRELDSKAQIPGSLKGQALLLDTMRVH